MDGSPSADTVNEWQEALHSFGAVPLPLLEFWALKQSRSSGIFGRSWSSRHFQLLLDGELVWGKSEGHATDSRHGVSMRLAQLQLTALKGKQHCVNIQYTGAQGAPEQLVLSLPDAPAASGMMAHVRVLQALLNQLAAQTSDEATSPFDEHWDSAPPHEAAVQLPPASGQPPPGQAAVQPRDSPKEPPGTVHTEPRNLLHQFEASLVQAVDHPTWAQQPVGSAAEGGADSSSHDDEGSAAEGGADSSSHDDEGSAAEGGAGSFSAEDSRIAPTVAHPHGALHSAEPRAADVDATPPSPTASLAHTAPPPSPAVPPPSPASFAQRLASIRSEAPAPLADLFKKRHQASKPVKAQQGPSSVTPPGGSAKPHLATAHAFMHSAVPSFVHAEYSQLPPRASSSSPASTAGSEASVHSSPPVPLPPTQQINEHGMVAAAPPTAAQGAAPHSMVAAAPPTAAQGAASGSAPLPWHLPLEELQLVKRQVAALGASVATFADEARGDLVQHRQEGGWAPPDSKRSRPGTAATPPELQLGGGHSPSRRWQEEALYMPAHPGGRGHHAHPWGGDLHGTPPPTTAHHAPALHDAGQSHPKQWDSMPLSHQSPRAHSPSLQDQSLAAPVRAAPPPSPHEGGKGSPNSTSSHLTAQHSISTVIHQHAADLKFWFAWCLHADLQAARPCPAGSEGARCTLRAVQEALLDCLVISTHQVESDAERSPSGAAGQAGAASLAGAVAQAMRRPAGAPPGHTHSTLRAISVQVQSSDAHALSTTVEGSGLDFQQAVTLLLLVARWSMTGSLALSVSHMQVQPEDGTHLHDLCESYLAPWVFALRRHGQAWTSSAPPHTPRAPVPSHDQALSPRPAAPETPLALTFACLPPVPPTPVDASPFHSTWRSDASQYIPPTPELPPTTSHHGDRSIAQHGSRRHLASTSLSRRIKMSSAGEPWLCSQEGVFLLLGRNKAPLSVLFEHYSGGNRLMAPPAMLRLLIDFDVVPALVRQGQVMDALLGVLADDAAATAPNTQPGSCADTLRSPLQARYAFQFHAGGAGAPAVRGVDASLAGRGGSLSAGLYQDMYKATVGSGYADQGMLISLYHMLELLPRLAVLAFDSPSALARGGLFSTAPVTPEQSTATSLGRLLRQMAGAQGGKRVIWQARGSHLPRFSVFGEPRQGGIGGGATGGLEYLQGRSIGRGGRPRPNWR